MSDARDASDASNASDAALNIGEAARATGLSTRMIRHYERIALLPAPPRSDAGYRRYTSADIAALRFIEQARRLGFTLQQIGELMGLWSDSQRSSREVKAIAQRQLAELRERIDDLAAVEQALVQLVDACRGDADPHCEILERLAADDAAPARGKHAPRVDRREARPARPRPAGAPAPDEPHAPHAALMAWTHRRRESAR